MALDSVIERRQAPRVDLNVPVRHTGQTSTEAWRNTRDISATGMRMMAGQAYPKGDRLDLEILLPDGSWLRIIAKVAWSVKLDVGAASEYEVGLRFLELDQQALTRLHALLPPPPGLSPA